MTIPKSYEALAADLASEKIISKTLLVQKEAYMKIADKGGLDLSESKAREAALREELLELSRKLDVFYSRSHGIKNLSAIEEANDKVALLQQRLTVAEQREANLLGTLAGVYQSCLLAGTKETLALAQCIESATEKDALKPSAEGEGS